MHFPGRWPAILLVALAVSCLAPAPVRAQEDLDRVLQDAARDWKEGSPSGRQRFFQRIAAAWPRRPSGTPLSGRGLSRSECERPPDGGDLHWSNTPGSRAVHPGADGASQGYRSHREGRGGRCAGPVRPAGVHRDRGPGRGCRCPARPAVSGGGVCPGVPRRDGVPGPRRIVQGEGPRGAAEGARGHRTGPPVRKLGPPASLRCAETDRCGSISRGTPTPRSVPGWPTPLSCCATIRHRAWLRCGR